ncbi:TetR/AcrR family transcriptional regulator [Nocardioides sp. T2.26MG-1]|uniref:TetR/AcrR family transcriptional regulator n=1 Tax=Nocardioides sp. T2.26MG-1 TaxID=3041166 RepID=UPI0024775736|nr:TetR family transcriptional regulator [Nocardioides sp. T2.26MG-1]CAI9419215.1 hypothetical protein HIDPHFAB_03580 [Nocardioides sp. T2.26MG-1]
MSTTRSAEGQARPAPGLRERKKARTRFEIQQEALRLFREKGYAATTVEQIAEAAEVSPSTFFRYFPTKASLVLTDDFDPVFIENFRAQPAELGVVAAMRAAVRATFADMPADQAAAAEQRNAMMLAEPELRAAFAEFLLDSTRLLLGLVVERTGRAEDDPEVVAVSGAIMGVLLSALLLSGASVGELVARIDTLDTQLARLESGFSL